MIKDLNEFYKNDINREVFKVKVKLWRTHLLKLSVHDHLNVLDKCNKDLFQMYLNYFKFLQHYLLHRINQKNVFLY